MSPPAENSAMWRAREIELRQILDRDLLASEFDGLAERALRGERKQPRRGEFALRQNRHHFAADRARGADNGD